METQLLKRCVRYADWEGNPGVGVGGEYFWVKILKGSYHFGEVFPHQLHVIEPWFLQLDTHKHFYQHKHSNKNTVVKNVHVTCNSDAISVSGRFHAYIPLWPTWVILFSTYIDQDSKASKESNKVKGKSPTGRERTASSAFQSATRWIKRK